ncbi:hypothetical protein DFA_05131 [Cavenderia fasciculata]|uniref:Ankyrin repeat-containing protein n=1 Tax=Cavenderia fasciculata TaxID=261658 RepID=F4PNE8_CACFS|nr:uncharacterized protein DFA_05131 [Cavenderia fasciculata]EGG23001.1 hypothetical protein DFA_05131 [Cavenderia fasciculata]|eukprot:XP_004360852.1 hypothetical protein DFA_05131 [Cavenderia fasciculata]
MSINNNSNISSKEELFSKIFGSLTLRRGIFNHVKDLTTEMVRPYFEWDGRPRHCCVFSWKQLQTKIILLSKYGYFESVKKLLLKKAKTTKADCIKEIINCAANKGDIDMLEFCLQQVNELVKINNKLKAYSFFDRVTANTALKGQFKALKHVIDNLNRFHMDVYLSPFFTSSLALALAFTSSYLPMNLDMVKYICNVGKDTFATKDYALGASHAAQVGNIEIIKYLKTISSDIHLYLSSILQNAMDNKQLEVLKYLDSVDPISQHSKDLYIDVTGPLCNGFYDIVVFINEHISPIKVLRSHKVCGLSIDLAAKSGSLETVEYLNRVDPESCSEKAMTEAALKGDIEIVKFLHQHRTEGCSGGTVLQAALKGHKEVVDFLYHNRTEPIGEFVEHMLIRSQGSTIAFYGSQMHSLLINNRTELN